MKDDRYTCDKHPEEPIMSSLLSVTSAELLF